MNVSLFQAAAAMNANCRWQEVISENLASSSIPGFKKQEISLAAAKAGLSADGMGQQSFTIPKPTTITNFTPGELRFTGNKNDVAIEGKGFFNVQLPNGSTAHTRDGEFQISSQGQLITKQGYPVLGENGPITIDLSKSEPITISATGEVSQGAELKDKLKVTDFDRPDLLTQISGGYFLADNPNLKSQPSESTFKQGYLEGSNISVVGEMANMMTSMRAFEANQRMIQMQDERLGKAISELGNPN